MVYLESELGIIRMKKLVSNRTNALKNTEILNSVLLAANVVTGN